MILSISTANSQQKKREQICIHIIQMWQRHTSRQSCLPYWLWTIHMNNICENCGHFSCDTDFYWQYFIFLFWMLHVYHIVLVIYFAIWSMVWYHLICSHWILRLCYIYMVHCFQTKGICLVKLYKCLFRHNNKVCVYYRHLTNSFILHCYMNFHSYFSNS